MRHRSPVRPRGRRRLRHRDRRARQGGRRAPLPRRRHRGPRRPGPLREGLGPAGRRPLRPRPAAGRALAADVRTGDPRVDSGPSAVRPGPPFTPRRLGSVLPMRVPAPDPRTHPPMRLDNAESGAPRRAQEVLAESGSDTALTRRSHPDSAGAGASAQERVGRLVAEAALGVQAAARARNRGRSGYICSPPALERVEHLAPVRPGVERLEHPLDLGEHRVEGRPVGVPREVQGHRVPAVARAQPEVVAATVRTSQTCTGPTRRGARPVTASSAAAAWARGRKNSDCSSSPALGVNSGLKWGSRWCHGPRRVELGRRGDRVDAGHRVLRRGRRLDPEERGCGSVALPPRAA